MIVPARYILAAIALSLPGVAAADCCGASPTPTMPPLYQPSTPTPGCASGCTGRTFTPEISVSAPNIVTPTLAVNAPAVATAQAMASSTGLASASASSFGGVGVASSGRSDAFATVYGGGAGGWFGFLGGVDVATDTLGVDANNLAVASGGGQASAAGGFALASASPTYADARAVVRESLIEAVCFDARNIKHPAVQTFAAPAVAADYRGEIFRCGAGMRMQVTMSQANAQANGVTQSFWCNIDEALTFQDAKLACRARKELGRSAEAGLVGFGAGAKRAQVQVVEAARIAARREAAGAQVSAGHMAMDGGVGQSVW